MRLKLTVKRFLAYVIDMLIVFSICTILNIIIQNPQVKELNNLLNTYTQDIFNNQMAIHDYIDKFIKINYDISRINIVSEAINVMLIIIYFIIIPLLTNGKTIGLKALNIKISGHINIKNLFIRNIFTTGILYMIVNIILIHILSYRYYFYQELIKIFRHCK